MIMSIFSLALLPSINAMMPAAQFFASRHTPSMSVASTAPSRADDLLTSLFGSGTIDAASVAASCSEAIEWVDMGLPEAIKGPAAVRQHLSERYPAGTTLIVERMADGSRSSGFSWRREADGINGIGLRGITYCELDEAGKICFVQEGYESVFKLDKLLELIFKIFGAAAPPPTEKPLSFERSTPTDASGIVRYLWEVAYPGGADPKEALRFFADDCVYEDFVCLRLPIRNPLELSFKEHSASRSL